MTRTVLRTFVVFSKATVMVLCVIGVGWSVIIHSNSLIIISLVGIGCVLFMDTTDDGYYDGLMWLIFSVIYIALSYWMTFRWAIDVACDASHRNTNRERLAVSVLQEIYLPLIGEHLRGYRLSHSSLDKDDLVALCRDW